MDNQVLSRTLTLSFVETNRPKTRNISFTGCLTRFCRIIKPATYKFHEQF